MEQLDHVLGSAAHRDREGGVLVWAGVVPFQTVGVVGGTKVPVSGQLLLKPVAKLAASVDAQPGIQLAGSARWQPLLAVSI